MAQNYFDKLKYKKEALIFFSVSIFIFLLTCISLYAEINSRVLSVISAEPAGYVGYYDKHYDTSNDTIIKKVITVLEEDTADIYDKEIYVLNKDTGTFLSSAGEIPDAAKEELTSKINENLIIIDESSCKVIDFDHYKVLVKARVPYIIDEFIATIANLTLIMLGGIALALLLLALAHKFFAEGSTKRLVATILLVLGVVFSFAGTSLNVQLETLDRAQQVEAYALKLDLVAICQNPQELGLTEQKQLLEFANSIAKSSQTIKEVTSTVDLQGKAILPDAAHEIVSTLEIVTDEKEINNLKMNSQISAVLMLLLAFMIVYEFQKKARLKQEQGTHGGEAVLTESDHRMRMVIMVSSIGLSAFNIVNVLRIRQVVMLYWTDNVMVLIGTIFTLTMIGNMLGASIASILLKICKSVKAYAIFIVGIGAVGAFLCGASSNIIIFLVGLMIFNVARAQVFMFAPFYSSLLSDVNRKDSCQVEFAAGESLGRVVGNIIGGVISVVMSFAVVQMSAALCFAIAVFMCLAFSKSELAVNLAEAGNAKSSGSDILKIMLRGDVLIYSICIILPASVAYNLVQYKLPLDVATLGMSALVISLATTMQRVIQTYASPLFHVINRHMNITFHAVAYVAITGALVLFYMLDDSLGGMIVSVAAMGFMDGVGVYATTKEFREMEVLASTPESDRMVSLELVRRIGGTISPTLLSVLGSGATLPIMIIVAPLAYLAKFRLGLHTNHKH